MSALPYNTWPLRVKLFTSEASRIWNSLMNSSAVGSEIPAGFTFTTELEGVDGQSGQSGSGRTAPIEVTDGVCSSN